MRSLLGWPAFLFVAGSILILSCGASEAGGTAGAGGSAGSAGANYNGGTGGAGTGGSAGENGTGGTSHGPAGPGGSGGTAGVGGKTDTGGASTASTGGTGGAGGSGTGTPPCPSPGTPATFYMSSDDSGSMGSPTLAREYLTAGRAPPQASIRTYEFLNYYRVRYPMPAGGELGVHASFVPEGDAYRLQVGVQAPAVKRPSMALTFVVDISGSLVGEGLSRERAAISAIAKNLQAGDVVNFVTWSSEEKDDLEGHVFSGPDDPTLVNLINSLVPGGGSDLHAGLTRGYSLAEQTKSTTRLSRVVLISDGGANLGVLDRELIAAAAKEGDAEEIYLVGVGVGPADGYSDALMDLVTDAGRGSYVYLDSEEEADRALGGRFDEVMDIAARAVEVTLTLPAYFEIKSFYGEGYSPTKELIEPQHLAPADSMIFNQVLSVRDGGSVCDGDAVTVHVDWTAPLLHPGSAMPFVELTKPLSELTGESWQMLKARAVIDYAEALKSRKAADFDKAAASVEAARNDPKLLAEDPYEAELDEIAVLLGDFPEADKVP